MRPNPTQIVQYWHSADVPADVTELTATFRNRNPKMHHRLFHRTEAEEFIAEHFSAHEVGAFRECGVPAMQADYLRYCAGLILGGICSDVDFRCLMPLDLILRPEDEGLLVRLPSRRRAGEMLMNGFFMFRSPGHPLLRLAIDVATANIEQRATRGVYLVTGPGVFSILRWLDTNASRGAAPDLISNRLRPLISSAIQAIDDLDRVGEAFRRVRIVPLSVARGWLGRPSSQLQYKLGEDHWLNWQRRGRDIFRRA